MSRIGDNAHVAASIALTLYTIAMVVISALAVIATLIGTLLAIVPLFEGGGAFWSPAWAIWFTIAFLIAVHNTSVSIELINEPSVSGHRRVLLFSAVALLSFFALPNIGA